ncbi:MAG: hypothetical protein J3R72DRAFT_434772 [Linnemannia gamsii]|nr:MAG: hypothetical protein J3R72DRAFT_434772 [Linnemannia gamsii]
MCTHSLFIIVLHLWMIMVSVHGRRNTLLQIIEPVHLPFPSLFVLPAPLSCVLHPSFHSMFPFNESHFSLSSVTIHLQHLLNNQHHCYRTQRHEVHVK